MRLIDADKLKDIIADTWVIDRIDEQPTVEPKHGRWIEIDKYHLGTCSVCGDRWGSVDIMRYCPNCGARMDGKDND